MDCSMRKAHLLLAVVTSAALVILSPMLGKAG